MRGEEVSGEEVSGGKQAYGQGILCRGGDQVWDSHLVTGI